MLDVKLHLDADTSIKSLYYALLERGFDVTRTPNSWMPSNASDEQQLLGATAQGRVIFTFNIRDFLALADRYPHHGGIILASQSTWTISSLITALSSALSKTHSLEWIGRVRWLSDWRISIE
ncbi:MAG: DUF5615 family PIN-like protein [Anaerolineales bacterium]